jgi:hypothetical protein
LREIVGAVVEAMADLDDVLRMFETAKQLVDFLRTRD